MDLVPYISPEGEHKFWDRNDPEDYQAAEEFKLCGSDEQREAALEAWKAARGRESIQEEADAKAAAEKELDDWYWELTGMSAAEWEAKRAEEEATQKVKATGFAVGTPVPNAEIHVPTIETTNSDTHTASHAAEDGEEDNSLEAGSWEACNAENDDCAIFNVGNKDYGSEWDWGSPEPPKVLPTANINVLELNDIGSSQVRDEGGDASLYWGSPEPHSKTEINKTQATPASELQDHDNGGAALDLGGPEPAVGIDNLMSTSTQPSTPAPSNEAKMSAKELFAIQRKERNKEKRAAKKAAQASNTTSSSPVDGADELKAVESKKKTPDNTTDSSAPNAKPQRKYKPRAKKAEQAPAQDSHSTVPAVETVQEDDGLEAELLAALEEELGREEPKENGGASAAKPDSTLGAHSEKPGGNPSKPPTTVGKKKKANDQLKERAAVIHALRYETLTRRTVTSLDHAVVHIQSEPVQKEREIFIETKLPDIITHGSNQGDDMTMKDDDSVLPKLYHVYWKDGPNYRLLAKHMDLRKLLAISVVVMDIM